MDYSKELTAIRKGSFRAVYLIDTSELFFREEFLHQLIIAFFADGPTNLTNYPGSKGAHKDIIQEVTGGSLFSARQLVRVTEAGTFLSANQAWFEDFISQVHDDPSPGTILMLEDDLGRYKGKAAMRKPLKAIRALDKKYGFSVSVPAIKKYKVPAWLISRAKERYGISIRQSEAKLITENTGEDLMRIDMELDKMATYIHPRKSITREDINELILFDRENTIYELLDAVSERNTAITLQHLQQLLTTGTAPIRILYMVYWHIKKLLQGKQWAADGESPAFISRELNIPNYFMDKFLRQAGSFSRSQLSGLMQAVQQADRLSKSGADGGRVLERLLLLVCSGSAEPGLALTAIN